MIEDNDTRYSISIDENTAMILKREGNIQVFNFINNTWKGVQLITPPINDFGFGEKISLSQDFVFIASAGSAVYVYKNTTQGWQFFKSYKKRLS